MFSAKILLNTVDKVKSFVNAASKIDCELDLCAERYIIDAKSIMGIFSLDLTKEMNLKAHTANTNELEKIMLLLGPYMVK